jgi:hypothetical protein
MPSLRRALRRKCFRQLNYLKRAVKLAKAAFQKFDQDDLLHHKDYHQLLGNFAAIQMARANLRQKLSDTADTLSDGTELAGYADAIFQQYSDIGSIWANSLLATLAPSKSMHRGCSICSLPPFELMASTGFRMYHNKARRKSNLSTKQVIQDFPAAKIDVSPIPLKDCIRFRQMPPRFQEELSTKIVLYWYCIPVLLSVTEPSCPVTFSKQCVSWPGLQVYHRWRRKVTLITQSTANWFNRCCLFVL